MRLQRIALLFGAVAVAAMAGYSGYWFYARGVALQAMENWVAQQRRAGYRVDHGAPRSSGYPGLIRFDLNDVSAAADDGAWQWRSGTVAVKFRPWNFRRIRLEPAGPQVIVLRRPNGPLRISLDATEIAAAARLAKSGRPSGATVRLRGAHATGGAGDMRADEILIEADLAPDRPASHTDINLTLSLAASGAVLPEAAENALGRKVESLRFDAKLLGAVSGATVRDAVEAWRDDGGTVEVDWLRVVWGGVDLRAKGTLSLDDLHRPLGAFTTDIRDYPKALNALRNAAVLTEKEATMAKIGLALLAKKPPEGGPAVLTVPVTAQSGRLYMGPLKILDLPRIRF